ncbi:DUF1819 domain-containing protein [Thiocystis violacea]|nr:DUF1819 domain-containing protein [Thiocystis violacea]
MPRLEEATRPHTRLLKCTLAIEDSRAYWSRADGSAWVSAHQAFDEYWFGARSLGRIEVLLANLRARFAAFPSALRTLHRWPHMSPDTRRVICHWHLQLTDPLYRAFTGQHLVERRASPRPEVTRDAVVRWLGLQNTEGWTLSTRIEYASKLLSAAFAAGMLATNRDPRPILVPRVDDEALEYLLYLLRGPRIVGTWLDNPYLASVGLQGGPLEERLRRLPGLAFRRQGDLFDFGWRYPSLAVWADANLMSDFPLRAVGGVR